MEAAEGGARVRLERASLRFGARTVWDELDLEMAPGEFLAVLGPNGSGKTTLIKILLGLLPLSGGTATIDGRPPRRGSPLVGYVPQQRAFDDGVALRGRDLVQLGLDGHRWGLPFRRSRRVDAAIESVGASAYASAPLGTLSGGEQQRLRIAQALVGAPRLLLCDEPLLSLDLASQQSVVGLIDAQRREIGCSVVFVTHEINPVIGMVDRVLYVAGGRWAQGNVDQVLTAESLTRLYGAPVDVIRVRDRIVVLGGEGEPSSDPHHLGHGHR